LCDGEENRHGEYFGNDNHVMAYTDADVLPAAVRAYQEEKVLELKRIIGIKFES
jgi:DNA polymerase III alpha subunit